MNSVATMAQSFLCN